MGLYLSHMDAASYFTSLNPCNLQIAHVLIWINTVYSILSQHYPWSEYDFLEISHALLLKIKFILFLWTIIFQVSKAKSSVWKKQLDPFTREMNRADVANLQSRSNFLRNPRFVPPSAPGGSKTLVKSKRRLPKETGIKAVPEKPRYVHSFC